MRLSQTEATLWHISQTLLLSSSAVDINEEEIVNVNTERRFIMPRTVLPGTGLSCWFQCMACVRLCTRECGVMHTSRAKRGSAVRPAIFPVHCMPSLDQDDYSRGLESFGVLKKWRVGGRKNEKRLGEPPRLGTISLGNQSRRATETAEPRCVCPRKPRRTLQSQLLLWVRDKKRKRGEATQEILHWKKRKKKQLTNA